MRKVLFVSYGGGHINIINEVIKEIIKYKNIDFKVLALTTAYDKSVSLFSNKYIKKISDYKDLFKKDIEKINYYGSLILEDNYNASSGISKEDTLIYLGLSMFELVQTHGEQKAFDLYNKKQRQAFLPVNIMKNILEYEKTSLVVTTTSPRFEEASLIAANELGIETIQILDLFGELYPLPRANHIICMNNYISESLKRQGLIENKYYHFGQPAIEKTVKNILSVDKVIIKNKLELNSNKTLLYATQKPNIYNEDFSYHNFAGYETINDNIFSIFEFLYEKYNINILVRLHPNEDFNDYKKWFDKYNFVQYINNKCNLEESLAICDVLLNQASTVSVEAISANKDVFTFKYHLDKTFPLPAVMNEPFIFSDGFEELKQKLSLYFENKLKTKKTGNFLALDSVENILKLIEDLV
ncbi:hypothetical protein [Aliarcobacter butzleri]|uniref:hypothetical protein n=1 Tax=Aliarcobacter butzleri TaxID=28197 RepID=UPI0021B193BF|nr:hypothetical protein [Aliarcobacter butzleri]MCT7646450.1 hypothetical protein [Aliarcobacter butzleri]MDK2081722.1 hypothetical protein [Aliarcobacter butzleri]